MTANFTWKTVRNTSGTEKEPAASNQEYVLGDTEWELRRLVSQSQLIGDLTEQVMRRAGIEPGMNVLDCGCGVGDVSFLTARLVGSAGRVLGIDRSVAGINRARERAAEAGLRNVSKPIRLRNSINTDDPPKGVTARSVSQILIFPLPKRGLNSCQSFCSGV